MRLTRFLKPAQIRLELQTKQPPEIPEGWTRKRFVWSLKESILRELVTLMDSTGKVGNPSRLYNDLLNREKRHSTAIGEGIAIPHVRTMQAKGFLLCFARSPEGVEFDGADGKPVHFFFGVCAPPYDDRIYLEVYRNIGKIFGTEEGKRGLMEAEDEHEIIRILGAYGDGA